MISEVHFNLMHRINYRFQLALSYNKKTELKFGHGYMLKTLS